MKTLKILLSCILIVLLCVVIFIGCTTTTPAETSKATGSTQTTASAAATPSKEKPVVKIGAILPITGKNSWVGEENSNAMKLFFQIKNADVACPVKYELVIEDNRSDVTESVTCATKLAEQSKVVAVLGPWASANAAATSEYFQKMKIPNISVGASVTTLTKRGYDYYFRLNGTNDQQVQHNMLWVFKNKGWKSFITVAANTDFGSSLQKLSVDYGKKLGMTSVGGFNYEAGATDFYSIIANIKGLQYDGIMFCGSNEEIGNFIQQANEQGIKADKMFMHGGDLYKVADLDGNVANGLTGNVNYDNVAPPDKLGQYFHELYNDTYKRNPTMYSAQGWLACDVLTQAIEKITTYDGPSIKEAIQKNSFETMYGTVKVDETNENWTTYILQQIVEGKVQTIDTNRMAYNNY